MVAVRKESLKYYFSKNCAKHDKPFWSTISPFFTDKKRRNGNGIILSEGENIIVDGKKVCDIFNDYFSNIAHTIGFEDPVSSVTDSLEKHKMHSSVVKIKHEHADLSDSFSFSPVSHDDVRKKLRNINIRKATGYDNIPGKLLRTAYDELSIPFANLINKCMGQNNYPETMKYAEVSPIYKKENNLHKGNYRPVSVLTAVSKIYESVINEQMVDYFMNIFDKFLTAFRKKHSCQSLSIKLIEDWKEALDRNEIVGAVSMDLSKAFDCLPHGLMISKLHAYGFSVPACELIANYLTGRKQRVKIGDNKSNWVTLKKGVPQGSILGPLLFNIFINDLFLFIEKCNLYNYADDDTLSKSSKELHDVLSCLRHDCDIALDWFAANGMQANPGKFQFMVVSTKHVGSQTLSLGTDTVIKSDDCVKVLGVRLDSRLSFSEHVSVSCGKAAKQLNALARVSKFLDFKSRKIIYNSFILSNFSYCPLVWHFCGKKNNNKIEKIQERSLRILYNDYHSSYEQLLEKADTTTMLTARLKAMTLEVYKCAGFLNAPCVGDMFHKKELHYAMRNEMKLIQPQRRTTRYGLRSVSYVGAKLWNDLVNQFTDVSSLDLAAFKSFLNTWKGPEVLPPFYV